ncbi:TPA: uroporphyrinogen decarboxylase family protein [Clostridioides difficile]
MEELKFLKENNLKIPDVYLKCDEMVKATKLLKESTKNRVCYLPLCDTMCAQSLGGNILIDELSTPRVKNYKYNDIEELLNLQKVDFDKVEANEVLKAIKKLSSENEDVILSIEGPITILSSLIDLTTIVKALKNRKNDLYKVLEYVKNFIVEYAVKGVESGAKIISYADPTGNMDILGKRTFCNLSSDITMEIFKELQEKINGKASIHICGRTTTSLLNLGLMEIEELNFNNDMTYADVLLKEDVCKGRMFGQNCIKNINKSIFNEKIYIVSIL